MIPKAYYVYPARLVHFERVTRNGFF